MKLKLIKTKSYEGYYLDDIKRAMEEDTWQLFRKWFFGSTGAIHHGKFLVYKWDLDAFLTGQLNLD